MDKWEYKVINTRNTYDLEKMLNAEGQSGWEAVTVSGFGTNASALLKRKVR